MQAEARWIDSNYIVNCCCIGAIFGPVISVLANLSSARVDRRVLTTAESLVYGIAVGLLAPPVFAASDYLAQKVFLPKSARATAATATVISLTALGIYGSDHILQTKASFGQTALFVGFGSLYTATATLTYKCAQSIYRRCSNRKKIQSNLEAPLL